jgi:hypothetical protein
MVTTTGSEIEQALSVITDLQIMDWGRKVIVEGLDDPLNRSRLQIVIGDCRELHWSLQVEATLGETEADVIGVCPGKDLHREPAVLTTDLFELAIRYGSVEVLRPSPRKVRPNR